jgi:hypothetical protein
MSERKKKPSQSSELDMNLNEALARFLQTDPKEMADAFERNRRRIDEIRRSAEERRERLRAATRGPKKQSSL